jgi:5-methyltetrahydropteroyltriglutamate--homocysteine methyltransferase
VIDVKSHYVDTPEDVEERIRAFLRVAPAGRLSLAPDCGLSQTARWAAFAKLRSLVDGTRRVGETR